MFTRITQLLFIVMSLQLPMRAEAQEPPKVGPTDGGGGSVYGPITYDPSGNIIGVGSDTGVSSSYFYDPMGRLVTANVEHAGQTQRHTYTYDSYGNRTSVTGGSTTTYAVVASTNRLGSGAPHHAQYDTAGNLQAWSPPGSATTRQYAYDSLNMLKRERVWTGSANADVHHIYTADDERYWTFREVGGANTSNYTLRDLGGKVLRDYYEDGTGFSIRRDYLYRDGLLLAAVTPTTEHHYSLDHLGTPRVVTDQSAYQLAEHTYFPFGAEITDGSPTDGALQFTGHERDADLLAEPNGALDYMHARYYSSNLARFLATDPVGGDPAWPQSWNQYAYVLNDPVNYTDPTGMFEVSMSAHAANSPYWGRLYYGFVPKNIWGSADPSKEMSVATADFMADVALGQFSAIPSVGDLADKALGIRSPLSGLTAREHWTATGYGVLGFVDGIIPFGDPLSRFTTNGHIDGVEQSRKVGEYTRNIEIALASGPKGPLFGRGRIAASGKSGIFNRAQRFRVGWFWQGGGRTGGHWFGLHGGKAYSPVHWHVRLMPGPKTTWLW